MINYLDLATRLNKSVSLIKKPLPEVIQRIVTETDSAGNILFGANGADDHSFLGVDPANPKTLQAYGYMVYYSPSNSEVIAVVHKRLSRPNPPVTLVAWYPDDRSMVLATPDPRHREGYDRLELLLRKISRGK